MSSSSDAPKLKKFKPDDVKEPAQSVEGARCEKPGVAGACTRLLVCVFRSNCVARVLAAWRLINTCPRQKECVGMIMHVPYITAKVLVHRK